MKNLLGILIVLSISLTACKKTGYKLFEGEYDIVSSGTLNYFIGDTVLTNEPGSVIIKEGDSKNDIFMYVETDFVTSIAPLGVAATARIKGDNYEMDDQNLNISLDLGLGQPLSLPFSVSATGTLSDDEQTLTSTIVFSGGISGTMTSVGTRK